MKHLIIQKESIIHNINVIKDCIGSSKIIAVIKGDAYGLLISKVLPVLIEQGIDMVAVSEFSEAVKVRNISEDINVLMLTPTNSELLIKGMLEKNITLSVGGVSDLEAIQRQAEKLNIIAKVHIKLDTGFGRFGVREEELFPLAEKIKSCGAVAVAGVYSHLSNAFIPKNKHTLRQIDRFKRDVLTLTQLGIDVGIKHILNSAGVINYSEHAFDAVRCGSIILGRSQAKNNLGLKRVGILAADVVAVSERKKGTFVGYANTYKLKKDTTISVINIGYMDGAFVEKTKDTFRVIDIMRYIFEIIKKFFNNKRYVHINGRAARIIGRIGMCNIMCDVTGRNVNVGDKVLVEINPILIDKNIPREWKEQDET